MKIFDLLIGLNDILNNNDNNLKASYEHLIEPVKDIIKRDAELLYKISNRTPKEIKELDIKTFYTEVNLCKTIKRLNP